MDPPDALGSAALFACLCLCRFTDEIFSLLISLIFIVEAVNNLTSLFISPLVAFPRVRAIIQTPTPAGMAGVHKHTLASPEALRRPSCRLKLQCLPLTLNNVGQALLSLTAAYITFAKAVTLRKFRSSNLFNKRFRDTVADFAPTIGTAPTPT
jgi:hypothetical protein